MAKGSDPFIVHDCTLSALATGMKSQSLADFRRDLALVSPNSLYYHFWGRRLSEDNGYYNDFAAWADLSLHNPPLSEKLNIIDPTDYTSFEGVRQKLLEVVDQKTVMRVPPFHFIEGQMTVYTTPYELNSPEDLKVILPKLTHTSLFFHFIDARRRNEDRLDDFSEWISHLGKRWEGLIKAISMIRPYFISIEALREKLIQIVASEVAK